jgi:hypothetical protein
MVIFDRFHPPLPEKQCTIIKKILKRYILGIFITRSGGDVLYSFQVDSSIKVDLIAQFIAALSMFGEENVGKIRRIFIEGLDIELNLVVKNNLILATFFHPNMVQDYLAEESVRALDIFAEKFEEPLATGKNNMAIYEKFDNQMCFLIQDYLIRLNVIQNSSSQFSGNPSPPR